MASKLKRLNPKRKAMSAADAGLHEAIIQESDYLRKAYASVYAELLTIADQNLKSGPSLEVGGAGGFMRDMIPNLLSTDIRISTELDLRVDATRLPFRDQSLSRIYCKDSLHHIPELRRFFREAIRCVQPGGGIACVEPYWGPLAQVIYRFGHPEDFNTKTNRWEFESHAPMDSNQGLLYLLLRKHRIEFEQEFPEIEIIEIRPLTGPSYVLSGGASRRNLLPDRFLKKMMTLEENTQFWRKSLGLAFGTVFRIRQ